MVAVTLLGVAQDGGVPQPGCYCRRCVDVLFHRFLDLLDSVLSLFDLSYTLPWLTKHCYEGVHLCWKEEARSCILCR